TVTLALFALYRRSLGRSLPAVSARPAAPLTDRVLLGAAVFCAALPLVSATSTLAKLSMEWLGIPISQQEIADLFATAHSPWLLMALTGAAVVVVPIGEELLFRAGIFRISMRYLPRWAALLLSATAFALLHSNTVHFAPLLVLGIVFTLAYERTGSLLVPVIAHGLFNLNSIVRILAGVGGTS
ncbi:MAG TPA: CPBP family intramembrane glutamic endopeptidase, partial [Opitutaceae bacterium]|nr:CPBP family intramembrane glutamic endopeptidase [Opitutaceae bacterium]